MAELVAMLAAVGLLAMGWILMWRDFDQRWQEQNRAHYRVTFGDHQPEQLASFLTLLWGMGGGSKVYGQKAFVFEVQSRDGAFDFILRLPREDADHIVRQMSRSMEGVEIEQVKWMPTPAMSYARMKAKRPGRMLNVRDPAALSTALLEALRTPERSETAMEGTSKTLQFILSPIITKMPYGLGHSDHEKDLRNKIATPVFAVDLRIGWEWDIFSQGGEAGGLHLYRQVAQALNSTRTGETYFQPKIYSLKAGPLQRFKAARIPLLGWSTTLNVEELTGLLAVPFGRVAIPGVEYTGARKIPLSGLMPSKPENTLEFGQSDHPSTKRPVLVPQEDTKRHTHIIGGTGLGKSTLLEYLAEQALADSSKGLVMFDPHGDLVDAMTAKAAGKKRDVIIFDPTDRDRPVGFNLLAYGRHDPDTATKQITAMFSTIFGQNWGPRSDYILRMAVRTLMLDPEMTLAEVPRLLQHRGFRAQLLQKVNDPFSLGPAWLWYEGLSDAQRTFITAPLLNKVQVFLDNEVLRNTVGQSHGQLDIDEVVRKRKVLLVKLPGARIGDEPARLIGSMLFMLFWWAIQRQDEGERADIFCLIDEFQAFMTPAIPFERALSQARKFNTRLVLANQNLDQLKRLGDVLPGVMANTMTKVVFQLKADDARVFEKQFAPHISAEDIQHLDPHQVYIAPCVNGVTAPPVSMQTKLPDIESDPEIAEARREHSRNRYGTDRAEIVAAMRKRQQLGELEGNPLADAVASLSAKLAGMSGRSTVLDGLPPIGLEELEDEEALDLRAED
jgi:hypothetical protein